MSVYYEVCQNTFDDFFFRHGLHGFHQMENASKPPSTTESAPVTKLEASLMR